MKNFRFLGIGMMVLMLCMGSVSCSDDEYSTRIHELLIKKEYTFEADDETSELSTTVTFRNEDLSNYKANSNADWCTVTIDPKASTMTISVEENNTFEVRKATVTLLDIKDGVSSRSFTVTQKQNDVIRVVDGEGPIYQVNTDGGQVVIHLESNVSYTVQIQEDASWITLPGSAGTRGLQQSQVILDVAKNNTEKERSAKVTIKNETSGVMTTVLISQAFKAYMTLIQKDFTIDELGGSINIYVQTNVGFDCYTADDWVTKGGREAINDNTVSQKISVAPFTEKQPKRTSSVSIQNVSHGFDYNVKITQTRNIYIQESNIKILTGGSQRLTLYNANNEAVLWKSNDESVATVDDEGVVTGVSAGSTMITVASSNGLHTDNVSVTVEKPADLKDKIAYQWQDTFTQYDDVSVLTNLKCTITNNSEYDLMVNRATLYCDDVVMSNLEYNESSGLLAVSKSMEFKQDIPVEKGKDTEVRDTTYADDGTMVIEVKTIPGKAKENTHQYLLVWEYTYSNETFTYRCNYPEKTEDEPAATRKKYARRTRRR